MEREGTMPEQKTKPTEVAVDDFLAGIGDERKRADAARLRAMMEDATGEPAVMWGGSIVGFGSYHYRYASGHEGDAPVVGFSPRARAISLYLTGDIGQYQGHLDRLGRHKTGVGCLYITRLSDVDEGVLREMIDASVAAHDEGDAG
jgi:hypothetical protein